VPVRGAARNGADLTMKPILILAAALMALSFGHVPAHAQGFRELMEDIGIQKRKQEKMDFNERAPLALPPTLDALPPPEDGGALAKVNPQWPRDPDALKEQAEADDKTPNYMKGKYQEHPAQDIYKTVMEEKGRTHTASSKDYDTAFDRSNPVMTPDELREVRDNKAKAAAEAGPVVMVEPERRRLTDPPPGYRVPSPAQPYGPGEEEKKKKGFLSKLNPFK
jgi:hypothetical protein